MNDARVIVHARLGDTENYEIMLQLPVKVSLQKSYCHTATSKYTHVDHMCYTYDEKIIIVNRNTRQSKYINFILYTYYIHKQTPIDIAPV